MDGINKEFLAKCRGAHSAAELASIAKANNMEISDESAEAYFKLLGKASGALSDDELDNVAGGTCYNDGRPVVTHLHVCEYFRCVKCGGEIWTAVQECKNCRLLACCGSCEYCVYEKGLWLCTNEFNSVGSLE